ncbi:MAG: winged helix-turn-helix domain-containing protein [Candidatus Hodarchaeales archaeon]|jgi:DNA-binding transcriptional ArsR family regulator
MAILIVMSGNKTTKSTQNEEETSKLPQKIFTSSEKDVILDHWNNIPAVKEIYELESFKLISQGVRSQIVDLFREGKEEFDPNSEKNVIRHAFSAKEILAHIQRILDVKITLQNIYFHLSKLEDAGFITRITSIKEGRHSTHFFGRTARLFLHIGSSSEKDFLTDEKLQKITSLLEKLNPGISLDDQISIFNELEESSAKARERIKHWMEKNEKLIIELNIDFRDAYEILYMIDRFDKAAIEIARKIAKLFKYP